MLSVCCTLVCRFFNAEGSVFSCELREGSVNTKETTYVVSVLHIGVHYYRVSV